MKNNDILFLPRNVADGVDALRLRRAMLGERVSMPPPAWHQQGFDTLRSGVTRHIFRDRLRDLQRISLALCEWSPACLDADTERVLSWAEAHLPAPRALSPLLIRVRSGYDALCDLSALGWMGLVGRVSPQLPEVVVRDWLAQLLFEATDPDTRAEGWFDVLELARAVEASAFAVAVGDRVYLDKIAHCLITCPGAFGEGSTAIGAPVAPVPAQR